MVTTSHTTAAAPHSNRGSIRWGKTPAVPEVARFLQGPQPRFDEALAEAFDRGTPHSEGGSDGAILPALGRFEKNTRTGHFSGRMRPTVQ